MNLQRDAGRWGSSGRTHVNRLVLARRRCFGWPGPECAEPAVLARRRGEGSDQVCARFLGLASHVAGESATDNAGEMPRAGTQVAWPARTCQQGGLPSARFRRFFAPSCGARPGCCAGRPAWCCQAGRCPAAVSRWCHSRDQAAWAKRCCAARGRRPQAGLTGR